MAKAALHHHSIDTCKVEKERKKQVQIIQAQGGVLQSELMIPIIDTENNLSAEDLESLQLPPDPLQALLILGSSTWSTTATGELEIITRSGQVQWRNIEISGSQVLVESDCEDLGSKSDSDSSCTSSDSIARNTDFVTFN
ncbi:hypothetical protein L873DRAFT_1795728 [Choiromyces venosus 120613-1]|uniref:Uncharacterized protein n=1 Tax=Choiromyces venosus 120613-1 TaxID=1336337 RepID=A0A3N4J0R6_9PEZI|nr:hypothetical protein L873DRAFT_1795728 [Choiromyces venosus 120613-1]